MKDSQAEIRAIQAKLQAIQAGRSYLRQATAPATVERPSEPSRLPSAAPLVNDWSRGDRAAAAPSADFVKEDLMAAVNALQQRSNDYLQPFRQLHPQPAQPTSPQRLSDAFKQLEERANYVNKLAAAQETAILELKAIAERLERDWKAIELETPDADLDAEVPTICDYITASVPHIEKDDHGTFIVTSRSVDLFKAERDAALVAHGLRHRISSTDPEPNSQRDRTISPDSTRFDQPHHATAANPPDFWKPLLNRGLSLLGILNAAPPRRRTRRTARRGMSAQAGFSAQTAMLWFIGAVAARVALNSVLAVFPAGWLPAVVLIVVPVAIAIYRTSASPQTSTVWGYRLLLVMLGLLLGGRLS
ncbi:hypothetical protein IQ268_15000 [Oculatella sp. LEGE 06141]|uniref:hypothetical protein n=1 Tax=Oculatella sp. LEGE 06141 TaxID=1828648 RepID=UPI00187F5954|nr:hypothetical protein [Oculatella sp. LEGE 06141]MBE9179877.1 hypothetical protein [Oculatella sp. LEGE 06141]